MLEYIFLEITCFTSSTEDAYTENVYTLMCMYYIYSDSVLKIQHKTSSAITNFSRLVSNIFH